MSSILDALEKASKERAAKRGELLSGDRIGARQGLERRIASEADRHRRLIRRAWIAIALVAAGLLVLTAGVWAMLLGGDRDQDDTATPDSTLVAAAALPAPTPAPTPAPVQTAPTPTPWPSPTPWPTPTPWPSPAPSPTPSTTPARNATAIAAARPDAPLPPLPGEYDKDTDLRPYYEGVFTDGQIIRPADLGLDVGGVLELPSGLVALVNDNHVRAGQRLYGLHFVDIRFGLITVDVGNGVIVRMRF